MRLLKNKKGTAEIVGTALFLMILIFFFSNVFLYNNTVSRKMDQTVADKINSPVQITNTNGEGVLVPCTNELVFGGFGALQSSSSAYANHAYSPPPYDQSRGPPYGMPVFGTNGNTVVQDGVFQVLVETGALNSAAGSSHGAMNDDYIALNATYSFNVKVTSPANLRLLNSITYSFFGNSSDAESEAVDVYLYNFKSRAFDSTGLKILAATEWYNVTVFHPENYINSTGYVRVNYLSDTNGYYFDEKAYLSLHIDYHGVSLNPIALKVANLGGKDLRLESLLVIEENDDIHIPFELSSINGTGGSSVQVWIAAGSHINIIFDSTTAFDNRTLSVCYIPVNGKVDFKVVTNLGNTAIASYTFP